MLFFPMGEVGCSVENVEQSLGHGWQVAWGSSPQISLGGRWGGEECTKDGCFLWGWGEQGQNC